MRRHARPATAEQRASCFFLFVCASARVTRTARSPRSVSCRPYHRSEGASERGRRFFFVPFDVFVRVLVGYTADGKALEVRGSGTGGLAEMRNNFVADEPMYGYVRVTAGDDESVRQKFVLVSWCGEGVKALKKAKMSVHKVCACVWFSLPSSPFFALGVLQDCFP